TLRDRARLDAALSGLRGPRRVERAPGTDPDAGEGAQPGRAPDPRLATLERCQGAEDLGALLGRAVALDPVIDRRAVLGARRLHRDEDLDLGQDVLVEDRRPLGDEDHAEATDPPTAHDRLG